MHPLASAILITWRRNAAYAGRLVGDLSASQFVAQPVPNGVLINHPAWVLCHLSVYAPICAALAHGTPFEDPLEHRYGQTSKVSGDPREYPGAPEIVREFERAHAEAERAVVEAGTASGAGTDHAASVFARTNPLPRWRDAQPTVGDMLVTLMVKHESFHLGQLSAWRRAMGLASVAM